ncbi:hypothetical protein H5410_044013 [Solanum commersonii]|uniref:Uncharacterized protein n=1 Tax=Solanum commersonii TaxID=4109 RepID=A0A9J5XYS1_SOLCO|nr:hypothetical protein H5410_044013 [Solanum commersonii]
MELLHEQLEAQGLIGMVLGTPMLISELKKEVFELSLRATLVTYTLLLSRREWDKWIMYTPSCKKIFYMKFSRTAFERFSSS